MSVTVDLTQFNKAMSRYKQATGKTIEDSCNRQVKNLLIHSLKRVDIANKGEIQALKTKLWFNRLVSKTIKGKIPLSKVHSTREQSRYWTLWKKTARKIISKRVRAIGFIRKIISTAANSINVKDAKATPIKVRIVGAFGKFRRATKQNPFASISFGYDYKKRTSSGRGAERIMLKAIRRAIPETIKDMETYVARKLRKVYKS